MGAQKRRLDTIGREWKLNTRAKVKERDPLVYALLTDYKTYHVPSILPNGRYNPNPGSLKKRVMRRVKKAIIAKKMKKVIAKHAPKTSQPKQPAEKRGTDAGNHMMGGD